MATDPAKEIEALTREALAASEQGRWDDVFALYARRTHEYRLDQLPADTVHRLIDMDRQVQQRARAVRAATVQMITELQERQRKLRQWKQQWLPSPVRPTSRLNQSV